MMDEPPRHVRWRVEVFSAEPLKFCQQVRVHADLEKRGFWFESHVFPGLSVLQNNTPVLQNPVKTRAVIGVFLKCSCYKSSARCARAGPALRLPGPARPQLVGAICYGVTRQEMR